MTVQEHQLVIDMFARQLKLTRTLAEILKSRGILEDDDMDVFYETMPAISGLTSDHWIDEAEKTYRRIATPLGIDLPTLV